ncbi:uncharacterized protein [Rutidosis leptorrhynchoides]|uniref:uncharacterized protein n=1 Tax=Rutidosis leptorrhynchoides TaxID=125765 RepID=UPI003A9A2A92
MGVYLQELHETKPPLYTEDPDPLISTSWISDVGACFRTSECPPDKKTRVATSLLRGNANNWLDGKIDIVGSMDLNTLRATFLAKARYFPEYTRNDRLLIGHFVNTLNDDLREKISIGQLDSFAKLFVMVKGFESYAPTMVVDNSGEKSFKSFGAPSKKAKSAFESMGSVGKEVSGANAYKCFSFGEKGHKFWECPVSRSSGVVCFNYREEGPRKAECPELAVTGIARRRLGTFSVILLHTVESVVSVSCPDSIVRVFCA